MRGLTEYDFSRPVRIVRPKANGLDVFAYLSWLFRQITAANHNFTDEFLEKLMPWSERAQENC